MRLLLPVLLRSADLEDVKSVLSCAGLIGAWYGLAGLFHGYVWSLAGATVTTVTILVIVPGGFIFLGWPAARNLVAFERSVHARRQADRDALDRRRTLTAAETGALAVLRHAVSVLAPELDRLWADRITRYTTGPCDGTLGVYFDHWGRPRRHEELFLTENLFAGSFAVALATFLHEHAHPFGSDGSRRFTDALTDTIESVVAHRRHLDACESQWEAARTLVLAERLTVAQRTTGTAATAPDPAAFHRHRTAWGTVTRIVPRSTAPATDSR